MCPVEKKGRDGYNVAQLGKIAQELKLLPKGVLQYAGAVWNYRNYVHVARELEELAAGDGLTEHDREIADATLGKLLEAVR